MEAAGGPPPLDALVALVRERRRKDLCVIHRRPAHDVADLAGECKRLFAAHAGLSEVQSDDWFTGRLATRDLPGISSFDAAQVFCYAVCGVVGTPYIWGAKQQIEDGSFVPRDAAKWVHNDFAAQMRPPLLRSFCEPVSVTVDMSFFQQDNYQGLHRSGWSFVLAGLEFLDFRHHRGSKPLLKLDTCIERTFLWGRAALSLQKVIPYTEPWAGFAHHTLNTSYSENNLARVLDEPLFRQSLPACECLVTLCE